MNGFLNLLKPPGMSSGAAVAVSGAAVAGAGFEPPQAVSARLRTTAAIT